MTTRIFIAGHRGLAGSAIVRALQRRGETNLVVRTRQELDLLDQAAVMAFFATQRPTQVYLAAAKVGCIHANNVQRGAFLYDNLIIAANLIEAARRHGTAKLLFLGSSCIYPRLCPQPMREEHLLTGPLEPTNEPYAIAKIAGVKLIESYNRQYGTAWLSAMPTNLYGPNDNYDLETSHVLAALIRKFHDAKLAGDAPVALWGSGTPLREFLYVDDLADACLFLMEHVRAGDAPGDLYNVGSGHETSIADLARLIQGLVGHRGEIRWDPTKPDGTPRKLLDTSRLAQRGWTARTPLADGIRHAYAAFVAKPG